jgi:hypothetical protein
MRESKIVQSMLSWTSSSATLLIKLRNWNSNCSLQDHSLRSRTNKQEPLMKIRISLCVIALFAIISIAYAITDEKDGVTINSYLAHRQDQMYSVTVILENTNGYAVKNIAYEVTYTCKGNSHTASPSNYSSMYTDPWPGLQANEKYGFEVDISGDPCSIDSARVISFDK